MPMPPSQGVNGAGPMGGAPAIGGGGGGGVGAAAPMSQQNLNQIVGKSISSQAWSLVCVSGTSVAPAVS